MRVQGGFRGSGDNMKAATEKRGPNWVGVEGPKGVQGVK